MLARRRAAATSVRTTRKRSIGKRLEVYETQTQPLIEHYSKLGLLRVVAGEGALDEVFERMEAAALAKPVPAGKVQVTTRKARSAAKREPPARKKTAVAQQGGDSKKSAGRKKSAARKSAKRHRAERPRAKAAARRPARAKSARKSARSARLRALTSARRKLVGGSAEAEARPTGLPLAGLPGGRDQRARR